MYKEREGVQGREVCIRKEEGFRAGIRKEEGFRAGM